MKPLLAALALCAAAAMAAPPAHAQVACPHGLSGGTPPVNGQHIFCGEINRSGKAVGFHSRPGGKNPASVSNTTKPQPDKQRPGLYTLRQFNITEHGQTRRKTISTMYPDKCSEADVIAAIQHAHNTGTRADGSFTGQSGDRCTDDNGKPFRIQGFTGTRNGQTFIITGYPN